MLNLIQSIVVTFVSVIVTVLNFCKGPIAIGLLVGASIMVFANNAKADAQDSPVSSQEASELVSTTAVENNTTAPENATESTTKAPTTITKEGTEITVTNPEVVVDQSNGNGKYGQS